MNELKDAWDKLNCKECRAKRKDSKKEKNNGGVFCPAYPGCGNSFSNIDVLLITEGHSGRNKEEWYEKNFENLIKQKKEAYMETKPCPSFHIFAMRNLIRRIEELNLTWFLTDIWKCYLLNNKENKEVSFNFCRDYLIREIEILNPKIVILFGGEVKKRFNELARGVKNKNYKVILSLFPSSRTSDRWVGKETKKEKGQFWEDGIIKKIKENMGGVVRGDETN